MTKPHSIKDFDVDDDVLRFHEGLILDILAMYDERSNWHDEEPMVIQLTGSKSDQNIDSDLLAVLATIYLEEDMLINTILLVELI